MNWLGLFLFYRKVSLQLSRYLVNFVKNVLVTLLWCQLCDKLNLHVFQGINSLAPGRFEQNFRYVILKLISVTDGLGKIALRLIRWMPQDLTDDKSTVVQVMACCRQAISHYLSQCGPRFLSPYGVTRPQWVNLVNLFPTVLTHCGL